MYLPRFVWAIIWTLLAVLVSHAVPHLVIPLWACVVFGVCLAYLRSVVLLVLWGDVD